MKILVLGGTGMAGHTISIYFKESGHEVTVFSRKKIDYCNYIIGNIKDFDKLKNIIIKGKFDAIINAIGILNQVAESNKSDAVLLNSYLPHLLSEMTKDSNTKIIHMSTDCVFSGRTGSYTENSFRDGETFYDRSKALGELENEKDLTFRCSIIGPDLNIDGIGLFNWFMKQNGHIKGYTKAIWTGVTTITLARAMEQALIQNIAGIYNLVNNRSISKYDLLKLFNKHFRDNKLQITEENNIKIDKSLVNTRKDYNFIVPNYEEMIIEMKEWIKVHAIYSHYNIL